MENVFSVYNNSVYHFNIGYLIYVIIKLFAYSTMSSMDRLVSIGTARIFTHNIFYKYSNVTTTSEFKNLRTQYSQLVPNT